MKMHHKFQTARAWPCLLQSKHSTHSCHLLHISHQKYMPRFQTSVSCSAAGSKKYAVVGAGLAGMAVAWHLLVEHHKVLPAVPAELHVFEAHGIAAGGTGAAAGLLHPISPKGKFLWKGHEAYQAAMELVAVAAAAASRQQNSSSSSTFLWHNGMVRPATSTKQSNDFSKAAGSLKPMDTPSSNSHSSDTMSAAAAVHLLSAEGLQALVPGIQVPVVQASKQLDSSTAGSCASHFGQQGVQELDSSTAPTSVQPTTTAMATNMQDQGQMQSRKSRRQRRAAAAGKTGAATVAAGIHIPGGIVVEVHSYLAALWSACRQKASSLAPGSAAVMHTRCITSLQELMAINTTTLTPQQRQQQQQHDAAGTGTSWDAVVVAAGAATGAIPELQGSLPLQICQGYTLVMQPTQDDDAYPQGSPSILGSTYLSAQGPCQLIVGATKAWNVTAEQALQHCAQQARVPWSSPGTDTQAGPEAGPVASAAAQLLDSAAQVWPRVRAWRIKEVRSGMRAIPPRTPLGSLPLLGRVVPCNASSTAAAPPPAEPKMSDVPVYVITGLGSRGMVYHAWLGQQTAKAIVNNDDSYIAPELTAWQQMVPGSNLRFED